MEQFLELTKTYGLQVSVILFFIWWSWVREKNLIQRLQEVEDFQRTQMTTMAKESAVLNAQVVDALRANTAALNDVAKTMSLCSARRSGAS